ncbi:hypothetical protein NOS3756_57760 (plasmid) [Nostoc sp. NIES-3756]|uniref:ATP-binding protein n=1 Tax=Nostoc sp. NIES-3756 TaxID=1751286 RepID=UPI000720C1D2|nr:ATP-binding protein [Nostoc sp. NIES-3756]BAT56764.1 hypothetical protein NOS3756_57760 [Nostoc sp. NIES-3756]
MRDLIQQLFSLIKLQNPLIAVESPLQERLRFLRNLAQECELQNINCYLWSLEDDQLRQLQIVDDALTLQSISEYQPITDKSRPEHYFQILRFWQASSLQGILLLEGIFPWLNDNPDFLTSEWIKGALINLKFEVTDHKYQLTQTQNLWFLESSTATSLVYRHSSKTTILLGPNATLSASLAAEIPTITQELPTVEEIRVYLKEILPDSYSILEIDNLAIAAVGMYLADIEYGIRQAILLMNYISAQELTKQLSTYKIKLLKRVHQVEFLLPPSIKVGGLELMQEAFRKYKRLMSSLAQAYNLRPPKGILLIGPPGTGKSYSAKACSALLGIPLIVVEWGQFCSYGNLAEYKLKKLLALVDRIDRMLFYLDDFDKGFAGDDDLSRRLAGMLLTWMQERTSNVIIIASANNLELLPPELTRCGRFDDIFKVDLPNNGERHSIFKIHLARFDARFRNGGDAYTEEEWRRLLKETYRCVGAEIGVIVEKAATATFCQMFPHDTSPEVLPPLEITVASLLKARENINPLAMREADKVEMMRNRAAVQGLPSSAVDDSIYSVGNVKIFG